MTQTLVLAIDDEAPIRQWMQFCISQMEGFTCITAESANEGIRIWQAKKPDIIVTDIEMPGMDGLEMLGLIMKKDPGVCSIVLTSHEDFSYARKALHLGTTEYILKTEMTEESLAAVLNKARESLKRTAEGQVHDLKSRNHYLQMIAFHNSPIQLELAELRNQGIELDESSIVVLDLWAAEKGSWEVEEILTLGSNGLTFPIGNDHEIVVLNTEKTEREIQGKVEAYLMGRTAQEKTVQESSSQKVNLQTEDRQVQDDFGKEAIDMTCGISRRYAGPESLATAIDEARYRCSLRFYRPDELIFWKEKPQDVSAEEEQLRLNLMQQLLQQDFVKAYHCIQSYIQMLREKQPAQIDQIRKNIASFATSFMHFATDPSEDLEPVDAKIKNQLLNARNLKEVEDIVAQTIDPVIHFANETAVFSAPIIKAIDYMEKHYNEKFTLGDIAEQVAFSPEYFSRIFSKETGVNYITWLNNIRMKNAVRLLETTDLKVYEIAEQVGFASLSYFSTAFKKKFGKNPYEYQVNYRRGKR